MPITTEARAREAASDQRNAWCVMFLVMSYKETDTFIVNLPTLSYVVVNVRNAGVQQLKYIHTFVHVLR